LSDNAGPFYLSSQVLFSRLWNISVVLFSVYYKFSDILPNAESHVRDTIHYPGFLRISCSGRNTCPMLEVKSSNSSPSCSLRCSLPVHLPLCLGYPQVIWDSSPNFNSLALCSVDLNDHSGFCDCGGDQARTRYCRDPAKPPSQVVQSPGTYALRTSGYLWLSCRLLY